MAVDKAGKQYCISNLVAMVVRFLSEDYNIACDIALGKFVQSRTYALLCDTETGLWTQGPDYILSLYKKELGVG